MFILIFNNFFSFLVPKNFIGDKIHLNSNFSTQEIISKINSNNWVPTSIIEFKAINEIILCYSLYFQGAFFYIPKILIDNGDIIFEKCTSQKFSICANSDLYNTLLPVNNNKLYRSLNCFYVAHFVVNNLINIILPYKLIKLKIITVTNYRYHYKLYFKPSKSLVYFKSLNNLNLYFECLVVIIKDMEFAIPVYLINEGIININFEKLKNCYYFRFCFLNNFTGILN